MGRHVIGALFRVLIMRAFGSELRHPAIEIPKNGGGTPDRKLRRLDCAVLNAYLQATEDQGGTRYQTVRGAFREGRPVFKNSCIYRETHIQIAVRDPACILGAFRPPSG